MQQFSLGAARDAIAHALAAGSSPGGLPAAQLLDHGTMKLYLYEPRGEDSLSGCAMNRAMLPIPPILRKYALHQI